MAAPRIFVSHSHKDDEFGYRLVADLQAKYGQDAVWYDSRGGLEPGDMWWRRIVAEITSREYFVVIFSPDSVNSKWVQNEIDLAWYQRNTVGSRIIPILYRPATLPADWNLLHYVSFVEPTPYEQAFAELMRSLPQVPQIPVEQVGTPTPLARLVAEQTLDIHSAFGLKEWQSVIDRTNILLTKVPEGMSPRLWRERGFAFLAISDGTSALSAFDEALNPEKYKDADPFNVSTLSGKGLALQQIGNYQDAAESLKLAYNLASITDLNLRLTLLDDLTKTLWQLGEWEEALRRIDEALRMSPNDRNWLSVKLDTLTQAGREADALALAHDLAVTQIVNEDIQKALKGLVEDWAHRRFEYIRETGDWLAAIGVIDVALSASPNDDSWLLAKLEVLVNLNRKSEANTLAREIYPHHPAVVNRWLQERYQRLFQDQEWGAAKDVVAFAREMTKDSQQIWHRRQVEVLLNEKKPLEALVIARELTKRPDANENTWYFFAPIAADAMEEPDVRAALDRIALKVGTDNMLYKQAYLRCWTPFAEAAAKRQKTIKQRRRLQLVLASSVTLLGLIICSIGLVSNTKAASNINTGLIAIGGFIWSLGILVGIGLTCWAIIHAVQNKQGKWAIGLLFTLLVSAALPFLGAFVYFAQGPGAKRPQDEYFPPSKVTATAQKVTSPSQREQRTQTQVKRPITKSLRRENKEPVEGRKTGKLPPSNPIAIKHSAPPTPNPIKPSHVQVPVTPEPKAPKKDPPLGGNRNEDPWS